LLTTLGKFEANFHHAPDIISFRSSSLVTISGNARAAADAMNAIERIRQTPFLAMLGEWIAVDFLGK
jgi:hypothetical protein